MLYFLDTQFMDHGDRLDLISVGIVAEDGREYYACSTDAKLAETSEYVRNEVLKPISCHVSEDGKVFGPNDPTVWKSRETIRHEIVEFLKDDVSNPEIWSYYAAHHWVAFTQLWGPLLNLPLIIPQHCSDIRQMEMELDYTIGDPAYDDKTAIDKARWVSAAHNCLALVADRELEEIATSNYRIGLSAGKSAALPEPPKGKKGLIGWIRKWLRFSV